jgi:hypothetical protein
VRTDHGEQPLWFCCSQPWLVEKRATVSATVENFIVEKCSKQ